MHLPALLLLVFHDRTELRKRGTLRVRRCSRRPSARFIKKTGMLATVTRTSFLAAISL